MSWNQTPPAPRLNLLGSGGSRPAGRMSWTACSARDRIDARREGVEVVLEQVPVDRRRERRGAVSEHLLLGPSRPASRDHPRHRAVRYDVGVVAGESDPGERGSHTRDMKFR
jgi:hypothetical protein